MEKEQGNFLLVGHKYTLYRHQDKLHGNHYFRVSWKKVKTRCLLLKRHKKSTYLMCKCPGREPEGPCQSKICQLYVAFRIYQQILRFHVPGNIRIENNISPQ